MIQPSLPPATTGFGAALLQTLASLVAVCVLAWAVLRWAATRGFAGAPTRRKLHVVERALLDARKAVFVVRAGSRVFLLGGSDQSVTVLAELDAAEFTDEAGSVKPPAGKAFADVLARAARPTKAPATPPADPDGAL